MKAQRDVEENHLTEPHPWPIKNAHFCYNGDEPTINENEKKQHFLQHKNTQMGQKAL